MKVFIKSLAGVIITKYKPFVRINFADTLKLSVIL